jgi:hypothetical protein
LKEEWCQHEGNKVVAKTSHVISLTKQQDHVLEDSLKEIKKSVEPQAEPQPIEASGTGPAGDNQHAVLETQQKPHASGPWSLDWLSQIPISKGGNAFSSPCLNDTEVRFNPSTKHITTSNIPLKFKKGGAAKHSLGFIKRVARMSDRDRKDIFKVLRKNEKTKRVRKVSCDFKAAANSNDDSSKNSSTSVNKDWQNWVVLHDKGKVVADDVRDIGKAVGVQYKCATNNSFNLLTRDGRKEWREAGFSEGVRGDVYGSGDGGESC